MSSSVIAAECIYKSDWGEKKVSKKDNNLFFLEKDEFYKGKSKEYDGKYYRVYDNWLDFFVDLGDYYVFSKKYEEVLKARNLDRQLDLLAEIEDYPKEYCGIIESIIERFGLWEFDF